MKKINGWLLIGIIGVAVFGSHFGVHYGRAVAGRKDIWWTPSSLALPLEKTEQEFKVFVKGEPLQRYIDQGTLRVTDSRGETFRVESEDLRVRLNHWDKTRASFFHFAVFAAFFLGLSFMALVVGVVRFFGKDKAPVNSPDTSDAQARA